MPRLSEEQWASVRAERESTGATFRALGEKYGVSDVAVLKKSQAEGWSDGSDVGAKIRRRAAEKLAGLVPANLLDDSELAGANPPRPRMRADGVTPVRKPPSPPPTPSQKAALIDAEAEKAAAVIQRHRQETQAVRERLYAGLAAHKAAADRLAKQLAFEDLRAAKITSETLVNLHRLERQAWDLDQNESAAGIAIQVEYV